MYPPFIAEQSGLHIQQVVSRRFLIDVYKRQIVIPEAANREISATVVLKRLLESL